MNLKQISMANPGGLTPRFFLFACQFDNSYRPAFKRTLNTHFKISWIRPLVCTYILGEGAYMSCMYISLSVPIDTCSTRSCCHSKDKYVVSGRLNTNRMLVVGI